MSQSRVNQQDHKRRGSIGQGDAMVEPSKRGLADFIRSDSNILVRILVALVLFPFVLTSEIRQSSMSQNARIAALAGIWGGVLILGIASAATSPPSESPERVAEAIATEEPRPEPTIADESGCADFQTQDEAQEFYLNASASGDDPYGLDSDRNGQACEGLPAATPEPTPTPLPTAPPSVFTAPRIEPRAAPAPEPDPPTQAPAPNCHPSYTGACLDPNSHDYDCEGGSGNGPDYTGQVNVVGSDEYDLDRDGDGVGCEND